MSNYTFSVTVNDDFHTVIDRVTGALAEEGFGVLTTIDVQATMKDKLDLDREPYVILGACNPPLANQAISAEPSIGTLLPCNVVVRQDGASVIVDFMDPQAVLSLVDNPDVPALATEVRTRMERVAAAVGRS
ncbi:MAG TPA: DUF302 domain-containing protein [Acidimicrobiia bacterium]|jgi:uncharacterized protein (DUF302 family)|nr:DUF302 domain-containing protein [Acidimicrobiia bacterium]